MFGRHPLHMKPEKILRKLKEFELFCMGKKRLSPEKFRRLNEELSLSTVMNIGSRRYRKDLDGKHLIWFTPDNREHDLGPIDNLDMMHNGPGFHKSRTLALGTDQMLEHDLVSTAQHGRHATTVTLEDGTVGVGPNYKMALRNAALKAHLKTTFAKANKSHLWEKFYGNC